MPKSSDSPLPAGEAYLTPLEVRTHLRISDRELRRRQHTLKAKRLGRRLVRYRVADVLEYQAMLAGEAPPGPTASGRRTKRATGRSRGGRA